MSSGADNHLKGLAFALFGVTCFIPDALLFRLTDAEPLTVAFWRGMMAGAVLTIGVAVLVRGGWRALLRPGRIGLALAVVQALNLILFCAALWYTSAANTLVILASAPMIAAVLSRVLLGERVAPQTWAAILAVSAGVIFVGAEGLSRFGGLGELLAFGNAVMIAVFFVLVRQAGDAQMIPSVGLGYLVAMVALLPFADFAPLAPAQWGWLAVSGFLMLPGALIGLTLGGRYLPPPEVSMLVLLEVVLGPLLVWALLGEDPGERTLIGAAMVISALFLHAVWQLRSMRPPRQPLRP